MSGTSTDGIDAALVRVRDDRPGLGLRVLAFRTTRYPAALRTRLIEAAEAGLSLADATALDVRLGESFARAALALLERADVSPERVDVIGSHGHTLVHVPPSGRRDGHTCQLGSGDVIAERTGVPTVTGFRGRDMAVGGHGAPLVPYVDHLLFADPTRARALVNIGGIANVTLLRGGDLESVVAFDTGPGNAPIDDAVRRATGGRRRFDRGGRMAERGQIDRVRLGRMLEHPFLALDPPKSTGRDVFGRRWVDRFARGRVAPEDLVATLTRFTADSIADAIARHAPRLDDVWVSGGGAHNRTLMRRLAQRLAPARVAPLARGGLDPDNKEACAFAILAHETLAGRPGNLPAATGAACPVVLGRLSL